VAVDTGLLASLVLSTFPNPTIVLSIPPTVPVNVGLLIFAFKFRAVCVALDITLDASLVLSTLPKPTMDLSIPPTNPVKVGLLIFALNARLAVTSEAFAFDASAGTVGNAAVPPKSPANFIFPFVVASASGVAEFTVAST